VELLATVDLDGEIEGMEAGNCGCGW